jgi:8-oxo-dGTP pyrophosphatase MutT (NUDIX family)
MKGKDDHEAAAQEAFEEAGIKGKIHRNPMGAFTYEKRMGGNIEPIRVMVYVLEVAKKLKDWPEKGERRRQWMTAIEASTLVDEPGLSDILLRLNAMPVARGSAE